MRKRYIFLLVCLVAIGLPSTVRAQKVGPEFQINTTPADNFATPSIASDANGNFVVVWVGSGDAYFDFPILGQRYDSGGNPLGGEFNVSGPRVGYETLYDPSVASDASGNFVVVWHFADRLNQSNVGQRFDSDGNPLGD